MTDKIIEVTGSFKFPMGCRSFWASSIEKYKYQDVGVFNWGVYSVNFVRAAIKARRAGTGLQGCIDNIIRELEDIKELVYVKYDILKNVKAKQAPILYMSGAIAKMKSDDVIEPLLHDGHSTVSMGYVGLHNALVALYGIGLDHANDLILSEYDKERGKRFTVIEAGEKIMKAFREWCDKTTDETGFKFSMYGTPAETLATKFCQADIKEFGNIPGVTDKGYYENSFHYPSDEEVSPFEKLDIESRLNHYSSGGLISFVQLGDMTKNPEALEEIIRYAYDKTPFLGISTRSDRCLKCGYVGKLEPVDDSGFRYRCPQCGNENKETLSAIAKLCGYLGSILERPSIWGKMKEILNRKNNC